MDFYHYAQGSKLDNVLRVGAGYTRESLRSLNLAIDLVVVRRVLQQPERARDVVVLTAAEHLRTLVKRCRQIAARSCGST